jgi:multidrug transporter EmrE-like cation transporter
MSSLKDILSLVVGIAAAIFAIWKFVVFLKTPGTQSGTTDAILAGVGAVVAVICGVIFFASRVNKEEEIHITQ